MESKTQQPQNIIDFIQQHGRDYSSWRGQHRRERGEFGVKRALFDLPKFDASDKGQKAKMLYLGLEPDIFDMDRKIRLCAYFYNEDTGHGDWWKSDAYDKADGSLIQYYKDLEKYLFVDAVGISTKYTATWLLSCLAASAKGIAKDTGR